MTSAALKALCHFSRKASELAVLDMWQAESGHLFAPVPATLTSRLRTALAPGTTVSANQFHNPPCQSHAIRHQLGDGKH
eukprot:3937851-Rhodomonas_salina.3